MKTVLYTLLSFMLALPVLAQSNDNIVECPGGTIRGGICFPTGTGLPDQSIAVIVQNFMYWLLGIFGFLAIIAFVISGIQYMTSVGNEKRVETAKNNMVYSIIGVLVALSGLVIIYAIGNLLFANNTFF